MRLTYEAQRKLEEMIPAKERLPRVIEIARKKIQTMEGALKAVEQLLSTPGISEGMIDTAESLAKEALRSVFDHYEIATITNDVLVDFAGDKLVENDKGELELKPVADDQPF
jgi:hypothetical protein